MLFLIVCSAGSIRLGVALAVTIGLLHGLARAAALLRDVHRPPDTDYLDRLARSMRLRALDGLALLTIAGAAAATIVFNG